MADIQFQFLGSGDAFGSGGRFQTCFRVQSPSIHFLVDCGATSLVAMNRFGVDPDSLDMILLSHLHGDHYGGIPFFLIDARIRKRTRPLTIAGPAGVRARIFDTLELLFPGAGGVDPGFPLDFVEYVPEEINEIGALRVTPWIVQHPCGAPPFALRIELEGKTIAYSGDTQWTDNLVKAGKGADLFVCECNFYDKKIPFHLSYTTLAKHLPEIDARRVLLTHMGVDMLTRLDSVDCEAAEDGMTIEV